MHFCKALRGRQLLTHTKGNGCTDDLQAIVGPVVLHSLALLLRQACMVVPAGSDSPLLSQCMSFMRIRLKRWGKSHVPLFVCGGGPRPSLPLGRCNKHPKILDDQGSVQVPRRLHPADGALLPPLLSQQAPAQIVHQAALVRWGSFSCCLVQRQGTAILLFCFCRGKSFTVTCH